MEVTAQMLLVVCPLAFLAAFVDAVAGGGGLISLPAYMLIGLPYQMASGTNKFSASFGTLFATGRYAFSRKIPYLYAGLAVPGAIIGSTLGVWLNLQVSQEFARMFMLVALPVIAVISLIKRKEITAQANFTKARAFICVAIGFVCGTYDGFFGPGTGTILIMLYTRFIGLDMVMASGAAKLVNLASNMAALTSFQASGNVLLGLALPATACAIAGGYLGAKMAIKIGNTFIRYVVLAVVGLLLVMVATNSLPQKADTDNRSPTPVAAVYLDRAG